MIATLNHEDGTFGRLVFVKTPRDVEIDEINRRRQYARERSARRLGIAEDRRYGLQTLGEAAWRVVERVEGGA